MKKLNSKELSIINKVGKIYRKAKKKADEIESSDWRRAEELDEQCTGMEMALVAILGLKEEVETYHQLAKILENEP